MKFSITQQAYGKSNVRLTYVNRDGEQHELVQLCAQILLEGEFDSAYTDGNNSHIIPTDTMKNTVYAIAKLQGVADIETFAIDLAVRFVEKFTHVHKANVEIHQQLWQRIDLDGERHGHAFIGGSSEENTCRVAATDDDLKLWSGLTGLQVLKTTDSAFEGFLKDEFTSLQETTDRIFATSITAEWPCADPVHTWTETRNIVRALMLDVFAHNFSPSVQRTLYEMAESVLTACPEIDRISIKMPNQHHLLADLAPLNLENNNEVFVPTAEPFGVISATIERATE